MTQSNKTWQTNGMHKNTVDFHNFTGSLTSENYCLGEADGILTVSGVTCEKECLCDFSTCPLCWCVGVCDQYHVYTFKRKMQA